MRDTESRRSFLRGDQGDAADASAQDGGGIARMLELLHIENIAVIEAADIAVPAGLQRPDRRDRRR